MKIKNIHIRFAKEKRYVAIYFKIKNISTYFVFKSIIIIEIWLFILKKFQLLLYNEKVIYMFKNLIFYKNIIRIESSKAIHY